MFRPPEWWGCEVSVDGYGNYTHPDYFGKKIITLNSTFLPEPIVEYEMLSGRPRAPEGYCPACPVAGSDAASGEAGTAVCGRWANRMEKGWLYIWVLYWTITTMTTIGYGDFAPKTALEVGITIVIQLFGAVMFGWIIGSIASLVADFDQYETAFNNRMETIKAYLVHKKVPREMKRRVRKFVSHYYRKKGVLRESWDMLPPRLKGELLKFEHKSFFECFARLNMPGCDEVVHRLVECVRPIELIPGQYYVDAEVEPCTEIAFVSEGEISILPRSARSMRRNSKAERNGSGRKFSLTGLGGSKDTSPMNSPMPASRDSSGSIVGPDGSRLSRSDTRALSLGVKRSGTWFGHTELIEAWDDAQEKGDEQIMTNDISWHHSYRAKVATELLLLIKDDFCELLMAYPYLRDMLMVEPEVDRNSLSAASKRRLSRENQLEDTSPIKLNEEVSSASYEPELSEIERGMPPTIVEGRRSEEDGGEASLLATANAPAPISLPGEECASCEQAPSSEAPAAYKRANSGQIAAKAQMRKSQQAAQSGSSLQRQGSSGGGLGARGGMKSPTNKSPGGTPQQPGPFSSPRGRANWQKLKAAAGKGGAAPSASVPGPAALEASPGSGGPSPSGFSRASEGTPSRASADKLDWLKQRIAVELLGDTPCPPWELEEDVLFERLSLLVSQAASIVNASEQTGAPSTASGAGGADAASQQSFALQQLLQSMQRTVNESAEAVKQHLDKAAPVAVVVPDEPSASGKMPGNMPAATSAGAGEASLLVGEAAKK